MLFEDFSYEDKFSTDLFHATDMSPGQTKRSTWLLASFKEHHEFLGKIAHFEMPLEVQFFKEMCHSKEEPAEVTIPVRFFLNEQDNFTGTNGQRHHSLWMSAPVKMLEKPLSLKVTVIRNDPKDSATLGFLKKNVVLTEDTPKVELERKFLHVANWGAKRQEWNAVNDGLADTVEIKITIQEMILLSHSCDLSGTKTKTLEE